MECSTAFKARRDKSGMRVLKIRRVAQPQVSYIVWGCFFSTLIFINDTWHFFHPSPLSIDNSRVYFKFGFNILPIEY